MNLNFGRVDLEAKLKSLFLKSMIGDKPAYEDFLNLSSAIVKKYLFYLGHRFTGNENLEDLHQEVMLSIHQKKHTFLTDRAILPWIYSITRYRYIDYYRAERRAPKNIELLENHGVSFLTDALDFDDIMAFLTPRQKEMLHLVKVEGVSYVEAAETLNMSVSSLKVGIHRMMKSLQQRIKK